MRILIVKTSSLGDIIHVFPVLNFLIDCYPHAEIDWVVEKPFAELVHSHPFVNRVLCIQTKKWRSKFWSQETGKELRRFLKDLRKMRYDLVLDLQGNSKSAFVTLSARSSRKIGFGFSSISEWPNVFSTHERYNPPSGKNIREDYLFIAQSAVKKFSFSFNRGVQLNLTPQEKETLSPILERLNSMSELKILICPGSNWANKQLSQDTWQTFLEMISQHLNAQFFLIWGHASEKALAEQLIKAIPKSSLIDRLSLPSLQNLMGNVNLVIAMDSLPLHLAGTTSTSTYSVFGASSAKKYSPQGNCHIAFQGNCPYGKKFEKRCDILRTCSTGACIKGLEGKELFKHFLVWWSENRPLE